MAGPLTVGARDLAGTLTPGTPHATQSSPRPLELSLASAKRTDGFSRPVAGGALDSAFAVTGRAHAFFIETSHPATPRALHFPVARAHRTRAKDAERGDVPGLHFGVAELARHGETLGLEMPLAIIAVGEEDVRLLGRPHLNQVHLGRRDNQESRGRLDLEIVHQEVRLDGLPADEMHFAFQVHLFRRAGYGGELGKLPRRFGVRRIKRQGMLELLPGLAQEVLVATPRPHGAVLGGKLPIERGLAGLVFVGGSGDEERRN